MKRFVAKIILLFAIILICDRVFGFCMENVVNSIDIGGQGRDNYICNTAKEDILIFGSSRAVHHYNPLILEDSLDMSCYNCGDDGNGIILSYGRLVMAKPRHMPKVIIHDVSPEFDLFANDNHKYLGWLKNRYDRKGIKEIFDVIDKTERYKMYSQMYRYNSKFLLNLFVYLTKTATDTGVNGFRPLHSDMDTMKISKKNDESKQYDFDPVKLRFINNFIEQSKGAKLIFVVSPMWYGMDTNKTLPLQDICHNQEIAFIDFSNNQKYVHNNLYFTDGTHLNATGADEFTKDLIKELRVRGIP